MKKRIIRLKKRIFSTYIKTMGTLKGNIINTYWYDKVQNFGDQLAPALLSYYGFTPIYSPKSEASILSVGSILDNLSTEFSGYILGSGLKKDIERRFPNAKILAIRGELTRNRLGLLQKTILGDPGLLADRLLTRRQKKQYIIGLVPHFFDKENEIIKKIKSQNILTTNVIDVQKKPKEVIKEIDKCEYVLSSSLHGMIVADSLGIPNAWLVLSDKVQGKGFKFYDYFSSFGKSYEPLFLTGEENITELIEFTHSVSDRIPEIKEQLFSLYQNLKYENY